MLEGSPEGTLRPTKPLRPQAVGRPDGLFPHLDIQGPRDALAGHGRNPARKIDVLGQGRCSPAAGEGEQLAPNHDAVAAELGAATHCPAAAVQLPVERLLVGLGPGQPAAVRVEDPAPGRHRVGASCEVSGCTPQKPRLYASVGVKNENDIAPAYLRLSGRQGRSLTVRQALSTAPDNARDVGNAVRQGRFPGLLGCAISGAVIHHDQLEEWRVVLRTVILAADVAHESPEHSGFVASRDDDAEGGSAPRIDQSLGGGVA